VIITDNKSAGPGSQALARRRIRILRRLSVIRKSMDSRIKALANHFENEMVGKERSRFLPPFPYLFWWALILALAITDAIWLPLKHIAIEPSSMLLPGFTILGLLGIGRIYSRLRPDPRIYALAHTVAVLIAFGVVGGVFSYLIVTIGNPFFDEHLVVIDRAIGFDWPKMYALFDNHPVFEIAMTLIYDSPTLQIFLVFVVLHYLGMTLRSHEFMWLFLMTSLGSVVISGLLPTAGACIYLHITVEVPYVKAFLALRDGSMKVIKLGQIQGVVQFPSFHLALAVLFVYAMRGVRYWFPILFFFNALVILATPAIGGHHLADLAGGALLTLFAVVLFGWIQRKVALPAQRQPLS